MNYSVTSYEISLMKFLACSVSSLCRVLMKPAPPVLHQPKKYSKRTSDDRSDQSSVKSTASSSYPSPCASPSPITGKVEFL